MVAAMATRQRLSGLLRRHPGCLNAWSCLTEQVLLGSARAMGRIEDPLGLPFGQRPKTRKQEASE